MESSQNLRNIPKILVVGASSYVGARLYFDLKEADFPVQGTYYGTPLFDELLPVDIRNPLSVEKAIDAVRPEVVVLAAAVSNQAAVDKDRREAEAVNIAGCENVVNAAKEIDAGVIYLSTEAVHHGSEYGNSKLKAEEIVREHKHLILQLGMCFGASPNTINDRPHNRLLRALREKKPVSYDTALKFWPTYLPHLGEVLIELIRKGHWNDTIPVICTPSTDRYTLAKAVLEPLGVEVIPVAIAGAPPLPPLTADKLRALELPVLDTETMFMELAGDLLLQIASIN